MLPVENDVSGFPVAERDARKVLDQVTQERVGQTLLVRPLSVSKMP